MPKIAICDDEKIYLHDLQRLLEEYKGDHDISDVSIHTYFHPFNLLEAVESGKYFDIFLLDIYMPGMTGITLAQELRRCGVTAPIIFLTTSKDYALEAFGVGATQYLLKPFQQSDFFSAMDSAVEKCRIDRHRQVLLQVGDELQSVPVRNILYAEARANYQELHIMGGKTLNLRMTSMELFKQLAPFTCFARCGMAYILNLAHIKRLEAKTALMSDGCSIPIPRRIYAELRSSYFAFFSQEVE